MTAQICDTVVSPNTFTGRWEEAIMPTIQNILIPIPQLVAGAMPKLRSRSGIDTGCIIHDSNYSFIPDHSISD